MKEYYYCLDGQTTDGPHSEREIVELFHADVLKPDTLICAAGDKDWTPLKNANLNMEAQQSASPRQPQAAPQDADIVAVDHTAVVSAGSDSDSEEEKEEKEKQNQDKGLGKYQLIKAIRADVTLLHTSRKAVRFSGFNFHGETLRAFGPPGGKETGKGPVTGVKP